MTFVVYFSRYKYWMRFDVIVGLGDVLRWRRASRHIVVPYQGEVHLTVGGPRDVHTGALVTQAQAEELVDLVGPPALDYLRELIES